MKYVRNEDGIIKLGQQIRKLRKLRKASMEDLSFEAGIEYSQLSRIERGIINAGVSQLFNIAEALKVHPKELFDFE